MRNSRWYLIQRGTLLSLTVASLVGCDGAVEVRAPVPARLVSVNGIEFSGVVGGEVSPGPAVRVDDQNGNPLAGVAVVFETPGDQIGIPVLTTVESDRGGTAQLRTWKLGTQAGTQGMIARVQGLPSMTFRATALAGPAAVLAPVGGDNQTGPSGYTLPMPVRLKVTDSFGNSVAGVEVTFVVQTGAGSIAPALATTSINGHAEGHWRLGVIGANSVTASVPGLAGLTFTAIAGAAIPPFPATYVLRHILTGSLPHDTIPSQIVLAPDGSFTTYVNDITGSGTYTLEGTKISLKYAPGFWERMVSPMGYYPRTGLVTLVEESGTIIERTLTLFRCFTEDCYDTTWTYERTLP